EIMREREEEIRNIHKGMHTVNEIYKDLAHLVVQSAGRCRSNRDANGKHQGQHRHGLEAYREGQ
ncbi:hypothetical protein THAOC_23337, partial [Thalassiosira oceanica]